MSCSHSFLQECNRLLSQTLCSILPGSMWIVQKFCGLGCRGKTETMDQDVAPWVTCKNPTAQIPNFNELTLILETSPQIISSFLFGMA